MDSSNNNLTKQLGQQSSVIFELRSTVQQLTQELERKPTAPPPPPPQNPPLAAKKQQQQQTSAAPKGKGKKSCANIAASGPAPTEVAFTKVSNKKEAATPCFQPERTRLNRQQIVETEGTIPELINNDNIL